MVTDCASAAPARVMVCACAYSRDIQAPAESGPTSMLPVFTMVSSPMPPSMPMAVVLTSVPAVALAAPAKLVEEPVEVLSVRP